MDTLIADTMASQAGAIGVWTIASTIATGITAAASIVLAIIAWKGLGSLRLAQKDMVDRSTRKARDCAIDRCRELAEDIIPCNSPILVAFSEQGIPVFVENPTLVTFGTQDEVDARDRAGDWVREHLDADLISRCVRILNDCEAWAMYFTHGLADAKIAYRPCAPVFMGIVIQLYPLLVHMRARDRSGNYPNIVKLFETWYGKSTEARNAEMANQLLEMVRNLQRRAGGYDPLPEPIGTNPVEQGRS